MANAAEDRRPVGNRSGVVFLAVTIAVAAATIGFVLTQFVLVGDDTSYPAFRVIAAGDIAASATIGSAHRTADLLADHNLVLTLGDHAYPDGTPNQFAQHYDPTWGEYRDITRPTPGNHDYRSSGYFEYFGAAAGSGEGYYAFEQAGWQFLSLNSNCEIVSCSRSSDQVEWLDRTLADSDATCQLAYFHHPRISIGNYVETPSVGPLWKGLYADGVELVLNGHDHNYQRWTPMTPDLTPRDDGVQQFIVGTGAGRFVSA